MLNRLSDSLLRHPRWFSRLFAALTLAVIVLTLVPVKSESGSLFTRVDKLVHVIMFGSWSLMLGLTLLSRSATRRVRTESPARRTFRIPFWMIIIAGSLFGAGIELMQSLMPYGRVGDPWDMVANAAGAALAVGILRLMGHTIIEW